MCIHRSRFACAVSVLKIPFVTIWFRLFFSEIKSGEPRIKPNATHPGRRNWQTEYTQSELVSKDTRTAHMPE